LQNLVASKTVAVKETFVRPPATVMDTGLTSSGNIIITFPDDYSYRYILSFYVAELNSTANASSRIFYFDIQDQDFLVLVNPYNKSRNAVFKIGADVAYTPGADIVLYPDQTVSSPLGPIANALETWEMSTTPMATMTNNQDGELSIWL